MPEIRRYHVAFKVNDGNKLCTIDTSLKEAVGYAEQISEGWSSRAKSGYEWVMPNGTIVGVEREENKSNEKLVSITIFEREEIPTTKDIRYLTDEELIKAGYKDYGDFIERFVSARDPEAYKQIISMTFNAGDDITVQSLRKQIKEYINTRVFVYYQIEWYELEQ